MKKLMAVAISMIMSIMMLCAGAVAEASDVLGTWYGNMFGISMTLTLNEDGSYTMHMDGEENTIGTWELAGAELIMDKGTDIEITLAYSAEEVSLYAEQDGMELLFTRDMPEAFVAAPVRADAALEEFSGMWVCTLIDIMGMQAPPEIAGINMSANIVGSTVTLEITEIMGEAQTLEGVFAEGALTLAVPSGIEGIDDTVYVMQLLEDGTMSVSTELMDQTMTYYAEKQELEIVE